MPTTSLFHSPPASPQEPGATSSWDADDSNASSYSPSESPESDGEDGHDSDDNPATSNSDRDSEERGHFTGPKTTLEAELLQKSKKPFESESSVNLLNLVRAISCYFLFLPNPLQVATTVRDHTATLTKDDKELFLKSCMAVSQHLLMAYQIPLPLAASGQIPLSTPSP